MVETSSKDYQYDVSDSTDWLETPLGSIALLDASLRCQVCKEFYNTPMITSCSHTFCSLCIRRCLANDGKCPACRMTEQENKLRSNWAIEGVVDGFLKGRQALLIHAKSVKTMMHSPKRAFNDTDLCHNIVEPPRKKTRSSSRVSAQLREDKNLGIIDQKTGGARNKEDQHDDSLAPCPVCNVRMKIESIEPHLNSCLIDYTHKQPETYPVPPAEKQALQASWPAQRPAQKLSRLPQLNYSLFKEAALRKKLQELGISAQGSRQALEKRHTEWITLWNANCDASRPLNKRDLLHNLEVWERAQGLRAPPNSGTNGSQILQKDFDGASWAAKHDRSFQDLIISARKNLGSKEVFKHSTRPSEQHSDEEYIYRDERLLGTFATPVESALPIPAPSSDKLDRRSIEGHSQDAGLVGERTEHKDNFVHTDL